jgi:DNA-binding NarL/FixJ family response regulator
MCLNTLALVVSDKVIRVGIESLIKADAAAHYETRSFANLAEFIGQRGTIDLLLLDIQGMTMKTIERQLQRLAACCSDVRVIVVSDDLQPQQIKRIVALGVKGIIFRADLSDVLIHSLDLATRNVVLLSPQASNLLTQADRVALHGDLRPVDLEVLRLTAAGLTVKAIAAELNLSTRSVYRSRDQLREVLDVPTIETLIDAAREQGLLDLD